MGEEVTVTPDSPFKSAPRISFDDFEAQLYAYGSPWADKAQLWWDTITDYDHDPAVWLWIGIREHRLLTDPKAVALIMDTKSWTNARSVRSGSIGFYTIVTTADLRKAGITNRSGPYVKYQSVVDSLIDGMFRIDDPRYVYYKQFGSNPSIAQVLSLWTEDDAIPYTNFVVKGMNALTEDNPVALLTDVIARRIKDKGVEVHDIRDRMMRHDTLKYRRLPNEAWLYTTVHHTAVSRGVRSLSGDIESWINHSTYHVKTHGWPGIAYAIGISLSGRVFIMRDIEEEGYHAFTANANSIGIAGDLTTGNTITDAFKASLNAVLEVLHDAPEFPNLKDREGTFGHQEMAFVDSRNSGTACPGDLLSLVREYRSAPPDTDGERWFVETAHSIRGRIRSRWEDVERIGLAAPIFGYPTSVEYEMEREIGGITKKVVWQDFERGVMEYDKDATHPWDVTFVPLRVLDDRGAFLLTCEDMRFAVKSSIIDLEDAIEKLKGALPS